MRAKTVLSSDILQQTLPDLKSYVCGNFENFTLVALADIPIETGVWLKSRHEVISLNHRKCLSIQRKKVANSNTRSIRAFVICLFSRKIAII